MRNVDPSLAPHQQELAAALNRLLTMLGLTYDAFLKHKALLLHQARESTGSLEAFEAGFAERLLREGLKDGARALVGMSGHVERIHGCFQGLWRTVEKKIAEGTLFSDKAVAELKYVFVGTRDLLRNVRDAVLTMNPILIAHVLATAEKLSQAASEFATQHEERLVSGICQPRHSALYLELLDNLRLAAWHLKEMAAKLESTSTD